MNIHTHVFGDVDSALAASIRRVLCHGSTSSPRGREVNELLGQRIAFDMTRPIVTNPARKLGHRFLAAEAAWILSGRNDVGYFRELKMPFIWQFSDDGAFYSGAYGPRVVDQLTYVCDMLADDPDTRQAVIEVWRPNPRPGRDIPCTLSYQFLARDGLLHCIQSMRSSDVWLGYPYDAFNAAMLTMYVILLLRERETRGRQGLELGSHTLVVGSQHIYAEQWDLARAMLKFCGEPKCRYNPFTSNMFDSPQHLLDWLATAACDPKGLATFVDLDA